MVNVRHAEKYCCEDISLIENYNKAVASNEKWDVHHKLGLWFKKQWLIDNGFYYDQRSEMLVFIKHDEHRILHHTGKHLSKETKRKMCAVKINHPAFSKAVSQYTKDGEFIATYPSTSEAARQTGVWQGNISLCCHGRYKTTGGFVWRFAD